MAEAIDYKVSLPDGYFDAFARLRISDPVTLFDSQAQYKNDPVFWQTNLTGNATATHLPNESSVRLRTTTTSGDKVVRQTREYFRYQPGKSQLVFITLVLDGEDDANVTKRAGYFDEENGVFFEYTGTEFKWVLRSKASGSVVDTEVAQGDWNIETLRGGNENLVNAELDAGRPLILVMDFEWLGVGRVRAGQVIDGKIVYCHEFLNTNTDTIVVDDRGGVYMTTANLPVRYEIENTDTATAAENDIIAICTTVISEGGFEEGRGVPHSADTGATAVATTAEVPLISIRPSDTFNSITNRAAINLKGVSGIALTKSAIFRIYYGATLTNASFADLDATYSVTEVDTSATAISGGIVVGSFYVAAATQGTNQSPGTQSAPILSRLPVSLAIDGTHPTTPLTDSVTVTVESLEGANTSAYASIAWEEVY